MRINHNIQALNAYRNLAANQLNTSKNLERLSSGLRINRAADDAAGLAISEKMRSQIRGLEMAERNALDAVSLIQTAEGALQETQSILQRMRELSVQAANSTYTDEDRNHIQSEIDQLKEEIDRISSAAEFNNIDLLDGSISAQFKQIELAPNSVVDYQNTGLSGLTISKESLLLSSKDYDLKIEDKGSQPFQTIDPSKTVRSPGVESLTTSKQDVELIEGDYQIKIDEEPMKTIVGAPFYNKAQTGITSIGIDNNSNLTNGKYEILIDRTVNDSFTDGNGVSNFVLGNVGSPESLDGVYTISSQQAITLVSETTGKLENLSVAASTVDLERGEYRLKINWASGASPDHYEVGMEVKSGGSWVAVTPPSPYATPKQVGADSIVTWGDLKFEVGNLDSSGADQGVSIEFNVDSNVTLKNHSTNESVTLSITETDTNPIEFELDNNKYSFDLDKKPGSSTFSIHSSYDVILNDGTTDVVTKTVDDSVKSLRLGDVTLAFDDISVTPTSLIPIADFELDIANVKYAILQDSNGNNIDNKKIPLSSFANEADLGYGLKLKYDPASMGNGTTTFNIQEQRTAQDFRAILVEDGNETDTEIAIKENGVFDLGNGIEFSTGSILQEGTVDFDIVATEKDASLTFQIGANEGQTLKLGINGMSTEDLNVESVSVKTAADAGLAIAALDEAINMVSGERAKLGAIQNRLEHTMNNLQVTNENMVASESRIRDLDMAAEMTEFTKNNILNQAAQAMLAQSNQLPQGILQLLK